MIDIGLLQQHKSEEEKDALDVKDPSRNLVQISHSAVCWVFIPATATGISIVREERGARR